MRRMREVMASALLITANKKGTTRVFRTPSMILSKNDFMEEVLRLYKKIEVEKEYILEPVIVFNHARSDITRSFRSIEEFKSFMDKTRLSFIPDQAKEPKS